MTTTPDALTRASRVHNALRDVTDAARTLPANIVLVDAGSIYVVAPNVVSAERWRDRFPGGLGSLPLHVGVEGDVEVSA